MVFPLLATTVGAGAGAAGAGAGLSSLTSLLPFAGLLGGGKSPEVNVSQSASNTTSLSISTLVHNLSPGNSSAPTNAHAAAGAASGSGSAPPLNSSPFDIPYSGYGSAGANAAATTAKPFDKDTATGVAVVGGLAFVGLIIFRAMRKKG
jgi:hypothetical protein